MQKWEKQFCFPTSLNQTLSIFENLYIFTNMLEWQKTFWNTEQIVAHDRAILCTMIHAWLWTDLLHHERGLGCRKMRK